MSKHYCKYCGKEAKFLLFKKYWCCEQSYNKCPAVRSKNSLARKKQIQNQKENGIFKNNLEKYNSEHHIAWNKGLTKETSESIRKRICTFNNRIKNNIIDIKIYSRKHTKESREKISLARSKILDKFVNGFPHVKYYKVVDYNGINWSVHGTWEKRVAEKLNEQNIKWTKNILLEYKDDIIRHYNPDFFIIDANEYLEIKGYFSPQNKKKMDLVIKNNPEIKIRFLMEKDYNDYISNKIKYTDIPYYTSFGVSK